MSVTMGNWTQAKTSIADVVEEAVDVLRELWATHPEITVDAFMAAMSQRHAEPSAAQNSLRFLEGAGAIRLTPSGSIARP